MEGYPTIEVERFGMVKTIVFETEYIRDLTWTEILKEDPEIITDDYVYVFDEQELYFRKGEIEVQTEVLKFRDL